MPSLAGHIPKGTVIDMAHAQCIQCGRVEDTRSMTLCPICNGYLCQECITRHLMQCGSPSPEAKLAMDPL